MKNSVRVAAAAALIVASSAVFAGVGDTPDTGTADLWLFVSDPGAQDTFALDTGITMASLMPSTYTSTAASGTPVNISTDSFSFTNSALASFIGGSGDQSKLSFALLGGSYPGNADAPSSQTAGKDQIIQSNNGLTSLTTNFKFGNLGNILDGFDGDATNIVSGYTDGGTVYAWGQGTGVWGEGGTGNIAGSVDLYGQGANQTGVGIGGSVKVYASTANNGTGTAQTYLVGTTTFSADGTVTNVAPAPVPVPAAVWLFGSGLLGLMGVGRRRAA